jgi:hypothetical protein
MTTASTIAIVLLAASLGTVEASDLKGLMKDVLPCKAAAVRLCDRSEGITFAAFWKCGATLAARYREVDRRCVAVLKRYGQL